MRTKRKQKKKHARIFYCSRAVIRGKLFRRENNIKTHTHTATTKSEHPPQVSSLQRDTGKQKPTKKEKLKSANASPFIGRRRHWKKKERKKSSARHDFLFREREKQKLRGKCASHCAHMIHTIFFFFENDTNVFLEPYNEQSQKKYAFVVRYTHHIQEENEKERSTHDNRSQERNATQLGKKKKKTIKKKRHLQTLSSQEQKA